MSLNWQTGIWESNVDSATGHFTVIGGEAADLSATPPIRQGPYILKYTVPANKKVIVKAITITGYEQWTVSPAPGVLNVGTFYLKIGGVTKAEWRPMDMGYEYPYVRRYERTRRGSGFFSATGWSDGPQFASGTVFVINVVPSVTTLNMPKLTHAWLYGFETTTGSPVLRKVREVIYGTATDVLTYNVGANGFTLLGFGGEAYLRTYPLCAYINILVNGSDIMEVQFNYDATSKNTPPNITIPLHDGVTMYPGDTIEFRIADIYRMNGRYTAMIHSQIETLSGGGGEVSHVF